MSTPVELIKERLNILDVVQSYVKLAKAGRHYKGKSPFTNEKTPSFFVSPERGMYYCFSSGKGGDMFTFISELEGVDFRGALKILAERAGVELVPERAEDKNERDTLYRMLEDATVYFEAALQNKPEALTYLNDRKVTAQTIARWRIGYAQDAWRSLREHLKGKGYKDVDLYKGGLIKGGEGSAEPYDVFRNRIMFPIMDASGRVVGFSGRDQSGDVNAPKYVNSPETILFDKSRVLFGYDKAKQGIRTFGFSLIVEGQFDLVLSHQAGYTNAVAISGTAMSPMHIEQLARLSNKVVLALDSDRAGINSAKRAATLMLARDMDVKVARIVGGKDPADLVREDPKLLKAAVGKSEHIIPTLTNILKDEGLDERTYRLRVRDEVLPFIAIIPNRMDAEHFEELVATMTGSTKDAIHFEVERIRTEAKEEGKKVLSSSTAPVQTAQKVALPKRTEDVVSHLYGVLLWQKSLEKPYIRPEALEGHLSQILGTNGFSALTDWPEEQKNKETFLAETTYTDTDARRLGEVVSELLFELETRTLKAQFRDARARLSALEREGKKEEINELLAAVQRTETNLRASTIATFKNISA